MYASSCDNLCPGFKNELYSFQLSLRIPEVQSCSDWEKSEEGERRRPPSLDISSSHEFRRSSAPACLPVQKQNSLSSLLSKSFPFGKGANAADSLPSTPASLQSPRRSFFTNYSSVGLGSGLATGRTPSAILEASCEVSEAFPASECLNTGFFSVSADLLAAAAEEGAAIANGSGIATITTSSAAFTSPANNDSPGRDLESGGLFGIDPIPAFYRETNLNCTPSVFTDYRQTSNSASSLTVEGTINLKRLNGNLSKSSSVPSHLILIADDSTATRKMTKKVLQFQGYDVLEACDGRDCLDVVACGARTGAPIDIILVGHIAYRIALKLFVQ